MTISGKRNCIIFDNFGENFPMIMSNLCEVAKDNFIVLTTKDGARGIDYKGVNPAHVIMTFNPKSYSECVQALGRGCRELSNSTSGTVICKDPLTTDASNYLNLLVSADGELSEAMKINCKLSRVFHSQVINAKENTTDEDIHQVVELRNISTCSDPHLIMLAFESLVKRG
jgi:superfamily II DNA/RNA helicase